MDYHSFLRSSTVFGACSLLGALVLSAGGCSSTQTAASNDSQASQPASEATSEDTTEAPMVTARPKWAIDHDAFKDFGYRWDWSGFPPLQHNAEIIHTTAYHDVIIMQGSGATLSVLDANTGKVRWSKQVDRPTTAFFESVRFGETLYVASETDLYELNLKNGNTLDRDSLTSIVSTRPVIVDNIAIFGTTAGELFGFQMDQDFKLWSYQFDGPIHTPPTVLDDEFVAAISDGGDLRTIRVKSAESGVTMRIAGGTTTNILNDGFSIYVGSTDQSIYSFDVEDGKRYWRERSSAPITIQPVLHGESLYVTTDDLGLAALDVLTGKPLWNNKAVRGWVVGLLDEDELIVWTGRELVSVDAERGDILARIKMDNVSGVRTDMFEDGNLYIIANDGRIAKFSPR
ncbi:MAG: PQQ-binding-like beta-propeller repeat protein [Phycisphaerales bacterium]|nr:PQQ-binding-like beta-propeller repeat protein [Phycisphaerales bacterium]